jgi:hypothetical protein
VANESVEDTRNIITFFNERPLFTRSSSLLTNTPNTPKAIASPGSATITTTSPLPTTASRLPTTGTLPTTASQLPTTTTTTGTLPTTASQLPTTTTTTGTLPTTASQLPTTSPLPTTASPLPTTSTLPTITTVAGSSSSANTLTNTPIPLTNTPIPLTNTPISLINTPTLSRSFRGGDYVFSSDESSDDEGQVSLTNTPTSLTNTPTSLTNTPTSLTNTPMISSSGGVEGSDISYALINNVLVEIKEGKTGLEFYIRSIEAKIPEFLLSLPKVYGNFVNFKNAFKQFFTDGFDVEPPLLYKILFKNVVLRN